MTSSWRNVAAALRTHAMPLCLVTFATLVVLSPFVSRQLPGTHDLGVHQERLVEFYENVRRGNVVPIWSENAAGGVGRPVFLFVAPLPYYLGSIFLALGFDSTQAIRWTMILAALLAVAATYLWAGLVQGRWFGVLAALLLLCSDYFLFDCLERGALAECVAWGPFILVLYFCERYRRLRADRYIAYASLCFAGLILAHNLTVIMAGPAIAIYLAWIFVSLERPGCGHAWRLGLVPVGGALSSAYFWFPALSYINTIHLQRSVTGLGEYTTHIVPWSRLVYVHLLFSRGDELNVAAPLFSIGAVVVSINRGGSNYAKAWLRVCLALSILALAMTLPISVPLWRLAHWLSFLQFPWRWMTIVTTFGSVVGAFVLWRLIENRRILGTLITVTVLAAELLFAYSFGKSGPKVTSTPKSAANIRAQSKLLDHDDAFMPRWSPEVRAPISAEQLVSSIQGQGEYTSTIEHNYREIVFENASRTRVIVRTAFYPTWMIHTEGAAHELVASPNSGLIELELPRGTGRVIIEQKATRPMFVARVVSALATLGLLLICFRRTLQRFIEEAGFNRTAR